MFQNGNDLAALGLDPSLFEDPVFEDDFGMEAAAADFDIDALLSGTSPKDKNMSKKPKTDVLAGLNLDNDADIEVDFTDADMKDPALLKELQEIGGDLEDLEGFEDQEDFAKHDEELTEDDLNDPHLLKQLKEISGADWEEPRPKASKNKGVSEEIVTKRIQEYKDAALTAKRMGDVELVILFDCLRLLSGKKAFADIQSIGAQMAERDPSP